MLACFTAPGTGLFREAACRFPAPNDKWQITEAHDAAAFSQIAATGSFQAFLDREKKEMRPVSASFFMIVHRCLKNLSSVNGIRTKKVVIINDKSRLYTYPFL